MGRGDPSMLTINPSGWKTLPDENRVSPGWVAPTVVFAGVVARGCLKIYWMNLSKEIDKE